ncbi:hypothetical protein VNO78_22872 [Psophocarpus tetragonolobus]|uniref:SKP1 component dimerisation domain-containing protein n=1 Tax=Psophocarpus tetragonolobus TaxID=3891 RepID=A0AAN9S5N1_PSOTE
MCLLWTTLPLSFLYVDNVSSHVLRQILSYFACHTHLAGEEDYVKKFDQQFVVTLSLDKMKEMIIIMHRLCVRKLILLFSRSITDGINNKSVEFVREFFDIVNYYTTKEEKEDLVERRERQPCNDSHGSREDSMNDRAMPQLDCVLIWQRRERGRRPCNTHVVLKRILRERQGRRYVLSAEKRALGCMGGESDVLGL